MGSPGALPEDHRTMLERQGGDSMLLDIEGDVFRGSLDAGEGKGRDRVDRQRSKHAEKNFEIIDAPVVERASAGLAAIEEPLGSRVVFDAGASQTKGSQA